MDDQQHLSEGLASYHHHHSHIEEITWARLGELLVDLAERIHPDRRPDLVLGIAKGGVVPGIFLSSAFVLDFFPIKLSSRHNEQLVSATPIWHVRPTSVVRGKSVLLVDDICVTGRTLSKASAELARLGATEVRTAALAIHGGNTHPDYWALESDGLIVWPWDRETLTENGMWSLSPEYGELMDRMLDCLPGAHTTTLSPRHQGTQTSELPVGVSCMYAVEVRQSAIHGDGVFALQAIPRGAVIHRLDDSRVVDDAHPIRPDLGENPEHCDWLPDGTTVLMQRPAGYVNHSCNPNVSVYSVNGKRFITAMRDIPAGEEITFDYAINAVDGDVWECKCGEPTCRGRHKCDFFSLPESRQLEYLPYLDPWFAQVHRERILVLLDSCLP
jgi:hypoxanthine phosphoribosyltransferase